MHLLIFILAPVITSCFASSLSNNSKLTSIQTKPNGKLNNKRELATLQETESSSDDETPYKKHCRRILNFIEINNTKESAFNTEFCSERIDTKVLIAAIKEKSLERVEAFLEQVGNMQFKNISAKVFFTLAALDVEQPKILRALLSYGFPQAIVVFPFKKELRLLTLFAYIIKTEYVKELYNRYEPMDTPTPLFGATVETGKWECAKTETVAVLLQDCDAINIAHIGGLTPVMVAVAAKFHSREMLKLYTLKCMSKIDFGAVFDPRRLSDRDFALTQTFLSAHVDKDRTYTVYQLAEYLGQHDMVYYLSLMENRKQKIATDASINELMTLMFGYGKQD